MMSCLRLFHFLFRHRDTPPSRMSTIHEQSSVILPLEHNKTEEKITEKSELKSSVPVVYSKKKFYQHQPVEVYMLQDCNLRNCHVKSCYLQGCILRDCYITSSEKDFNKQVITEQTPEQTSEQTSSPSLDKRNKEPRRRTRSVDDGWYPFQSRRDSLDSHASCQTCRQNPIRRQDIKAIEDFFSTM